MPVEQTRPETEDRVAKTVAYARWMEIEAFSKRATGYIFSTRSSSHELIRGCGAGRAWEVWFEKVIMESAEPIHET